MFSDLHCFPVSSNTFINKCTHMILICESSYDNFVSLYEINRIAICKIWIMKSKYHELVMTIFCIALFHVPGRSNIPSNTTANWESSCIFNYRYALTNSIHNSVVELNLSYIHRCISWKVFLWIIQYYYITTHDFDSMPIEDRLWWVFCQERFESHYHTEDIVKLALLLCKSA